VSTVVWLARHAEAFNPAAVLYGRLPRVRLSEAGRRQALALADFLCARPLVAIYSSPMLRARQTARVIAERCPAAGPVHVARDLHEIRSSWQGVPLAQLDQVNWDLYSTPREPTDESLTVIRDRMCRWLGRALRRHAGHEVVGVSHGDPILVLVAQLSGRLMEVASIRQGGYPPTGSVYRLEFGLADARAVGGQESAVGISLITPTDLRPPTAESARPGGRAS
jgi:broad specificity phosphatase PhoE